MILLIDMDGTAFEWNVPFNRELVTRYPHIDFPHTRNNVNWDMTTGLDDEGKAAIEAILELPGFYRGLIPIPGAVQAVQEMEADGHEVFFCTSPYDTNPTCSDDKRWTVGEFFGPKYRKRVILTNDKTLVRGDFLYDDKPEMHGAMTPEWEQIVFSQPYNQKVEGLLRIDSWADWRKPLEQAGLVAA